MAKIETVRGPIDESELGATLSHEHIFVLTPDVMQNYGHEWWDEDVRVTDAVGKLTRLKAAGIDTIVDPTVVGLGRYIPRLQRVNAQVDINIVPATGMYVFEVLPHLFHYRGPGTRLGGSEILTPMFISDLQQGIGGTDVKAAFLKCAVEVAGYTTDVTRVHKAICEAHRETGAPIMVHTNGKHQTGRLAMKFFADEGVDLTKVQIAHAGDSNDLEYLHWILDQGAYIANDRFGLEGLNSTDKRVETIITLCDEGYAAQILLGHDAHCFNDFFAADGAQKVLDTIAPNWDYQFISKDVIPAMLARGLKQEHIDLMMIDNPRRFLVGA